MEFLCLLGLHKWEKVKSESFRYETSFQRKIVREIETTYHCSKCGANKIKIVNFDRQDVESIKNYKNMKDK